MHDPTTGHTNGYSNGNGISSTSGSRREIPWESWADDEISLYEIGATVLERRRMVVVITVLAALIATLSGLVGERTYTSTATVISTGGSGGSATDRLRGLASQFGFSVGTGSSGGPAQILSTPAFMQELAKSPVILDRILSDTIAHPDPEQNSREGAPITVLELLAPAGAVDEETPLVPELRARRGRQRLGEAIVLSSGRDTGALTLTVQTPWPEVSYHVAQRILEELNRFTVEVGQASAREELSFVEQRKRDQEASLRAVEDRLAIFLDGNRAFTNSPELTFQRERLEREVSLQQQILVGLAQAVEEARIRAVQDTPVLTIVEPPSMAPVHDASMAIPQRALLGIMLGGLLGVVGAFVVGALERGRETDDPAAERFFTLLDESVEPLLKRAPMLRAGRNGNGTHASAGSVPDPGVASSGRHSTPSGPPVGASSGTPKG